MPYQNMELHESVMQSNGVVIFRLVLAFFRFVLVKMFEKTSIAFLSLVEGLSMKGTAEDDVATFDQLSKRWWEPNGPMILLHRLNKLR